MAKGRTIESVARQGGKARAAKLSKSERVRIAKMGAAARWKSKAGR